MLWRKPKPGTIKLDFVRYFPHKFWISTWGSDSTYPDGFRYKLLTVRDEKKQRAELVILVEQRSGDKQEMHRSSINVDDIDGYSGVFWKGFEEEFGIRFQEQDFSAIRSATEFDQAVVNCGWTGDTPKQA